MSILPNRDILCVSVVKKDEAKAKAGPYTTRQTKVAPKPKKVAYTKRRKHPVGDPKPDYSFFDTIDEPTMEHLMCMMDIDTMKKMALTHKRARDIYNSPVFQKNCVGPKLKYFSKTPPYTLFEWQGDDHDHDDGYGLRVRMACRGTTWSGVEYLVEFLAMLDEVANDLAIEAMDAGTKSFEEAKEEYIEQYPTGQGVTVDSSLRLDVPADNALNTIPELAGSLIGLFATDFVDGIFNERGIRLTDTLWTVGYRRIAIRYKDEVYTFIFKVEAKTIKSFSKMIEEALVPEMKKLN